VRRSALRLTFERAAAADVSVSVACHCGPASWGGFRAFLG